MTSHIALIVWDKLRKYLDFSLDFLFDVAWSPSIRWCPSPLIESCRISTAVPWVIFSCTQSTVCCTGLSRWDTYKTQLVYSHIRRGCVSLTGTSKNTTDTPFMVLERRAPRDALEPWMACQSCFWMCPFGRHITALCEYTSWVFYRKLG